MGILHILKNYAPIEGNNFNEILKYINQNLFIAPVDMRPVARGVEGLPTYPPLTQAYSMAIGLDKIAREVIYGQDGPEGKLIDKLAIAANVTKIINALCLTNLSLLQTSKQSLLRYHGTGRVPSSFRANIISAKVPMDTVLLPRGVCYKAIQGELIKRLEVYCKGTGVDPFDLYNNPTPEVIKIFEDLIENSIVLIGRQPTLYLFSMLAFKCRLWKESDFNHPINVDKIAAMGMNVVVATPFNADFDGDQMYGIIYTDNQDKERVWRQAGVEFNWVYQKNNESVFVPKGEVLAGLHVGTKLTLSNEPIPDYYKLKSQSTLFRMYNNRQLMFMTPVILNGEVTSYGIEKVSSILGKDLKDILRVERNEDIDLNSSNFRLVSMWISNQPNKIDMVTNLMDCGDEWIKQYGSSLIRLSELYKVDTNFPEIESILKSKRSQKEKMILLDKLLSDVIEKGIKETLPSLAKKMPSLVEEMKSAGVKPTSVISMLQPRITMTPSGFKVSNRNLVTGHGEEEFVDHSIDTREILKQKAVLVPMGGYINTTVTDSLTSFIYKSGETSTDTQGILVKRIDAIGRYEMNSQIPLGSPSDKKKNELVRIKSCIYSSGDRKYHVAADELNERLYGKVINNQISLENGTAIGIICANAITENVIQSQLALKHGGKLFSPSLECLQIHEALKVIEIHDDRIILGKGVTRYVYPLPEKVVFSLETTENTLRKEDVVFYIDETQYVDYNIKRISSVIGFSPGIIGGYNPSATEYQSSQCISPIDGTIHYDFNKGKVSIGSFKFDLRRDKVYYYPDGAKISKFTQFCSGTLSPRDIMSMTNDLELQFELFYTQIKKLMSKLQILSIELLFKALFVLGDGSLISAINSNPFHKMKRENPTNLLRNTLGEEYDLCLAVDMMLGLGLRDEC